MTNFELSFHFFFQVAFILGVCKTVGAIARRLGQPAVVAEMVAGVFMGPSLFGWFAPGVQEHVFPKASMTIIYVVSQVGLALYMFLVGLEFQALLMKQRARSAASVSFTGILVPFTLGALLSLYLVQERGFFTERVTTWQAAMFVGAAMAITAFPVLARIIYDCGLTGTTLGTMVLAAGAADDAAAWCVLAIVLATFSGNPALALLAIGCGGVYTILTLTAGKRLLISLEKKVDLEEGINGSTLTLVLMLLMICAWVTDVIGIHAVFGAFILGIAMPRGLLTAELRRVLEPITKSFLAPLFFVYSGLNTSIGLVSSWYLWGVTLLVILCACLGKGVACYLAARLNGETRQDAMAIGALMNARGLMELIILNIGLDKGIITPRLFTIMVMITILTTLLATPLFNLVYLRTAQVPGPLVAEAAG
jgi:Kef-type K+ transport system membrane component KefB